MKILGILLIGLLTLDAQSAEPEKTLEALRAELRSELKTAAKDSAALDPKQSQIESTLKQLETSEVLKDEQLSETKAVLKQIQATAFSDKITELCQRLATDLRERSAKKVEALREKIDATVKSALAQGLKATSAKDLDEPISNLAKLQAEMEAFSYRERGQYVIDNESMNRVNSLLTAIQDGYLSVGTARTLNNRDAIDRLRSMASSSERQLMGLMPRSEFVQSIHAIIDRLSTRKVLTREEYEKEIQNLIQSVKKLDDLESVISKIEELSEHQRESRASGYSQSTTELKSYKQTYNDLKNGASTTITFVTHSYVGGAEDLGGIKSLLVRFALPRVLKLPEEKGPQHGESVLIFLQRILAESMQASDWLLLSRVVEVAQTLKLSTFVNMSDSTSLRQFLGGVNLERARRYNEAVASYLTALKSGSQVIPAEKIGDLLDALQKNHPTEYEAGIQLSKTGYPFPDNSMMRSSVYSRTMQGLRTEPEPANSTLTVPAEPKAAPPAAKETVKPADPKPTTKGKE